MMLCKTWSRGLLRASDFALVRRTALTLAGLLVCGLSMADAQDTTPPQIIRVEEDWELHVATPDPAANVPQVVCVFGPADPDTTTYAMFEINHGTAPDFQSGGMQLQCWWQDTMLGYGNHPNNREFDAAVDEISFTTVTELKNHLLYLEITNGQSVNWGSFGGQGYLKLSLHTHRENLNDYNSGHSVEHSRITYGKHRVNRYARTEVRYYSADGLVQTEVEDAIIFSQEVSTGGNEVAVADTETASQ